MPDYNKLKKLPAIFEQDRCVVMIGTLTKDQVTTLPEKLVLNSPKIISGTPERITGYIRARQICCHD
jgi:hypothetical protein